MIGTDALRFLPHPQIVAIDNNSKHLDDIRIGLFRAGLPCLTLLYDKMEGLELPPGWKPERIRILFLDLNLSEVDNPNVGDAVGPISEVLDKIYGHSNSVPFVIVFWTTHSRLVGKVMRKLYERYPETPLPVFFTTLDKNLFLPDSGGQYEKDLPAKIIASIAKDKPFMAMLAWEIEVEAAAGRTYDRIHRLVAMRQEMGTSLKTNDMQDVLRGMAKESWGKENAKGNPGAAITAGLAPIFQDHLDSIINDQNYTSKWAIALKGDWDRNLPNHVTASHFNSHCLVDLNCRDRERRGIWLEFTDSGLRKRRLWNELFGLTKADIINEFINCENTNQNKRAGDSVKLGLLEFTAACDRANNKAPLLRYGLCARIPEHLETYICWKSAGGERYEKHDAIHRIEKVSINDRDFILFINYRFVIALPPSHELLKKNLVEPVFRIRNQVLADISQRYANHTNRLGIYLFPSRKKIKESTSDVKNQL